MDYQNRAGSRFGGGGVASKEETARDRKERYKRLAMDLIGNIENDPYWRQTSNGTIECVLCLTHQTNESSYLAHTQGKKHQQSLARRAALDRQKAMWDPSTALMRGLYREPDVKVKKNFMKIGRPGYKVTKIQDPVTRQLGLFAQLQFDQISRGVKPRHRFMSAWEQKVEKAQSGHQYLTIAAEPYETVAFKVQDWEVDTPERKFYTHWDPDTKQFSLQFFFKQKSNQKDTAPGCY
jgi:splicing factor 3A subunit 2